MFSQSGTVLVVYLVGNLEKPYKNKGYLGNDGEVGAINRDPICTG